MASDRKSSSPQSLSRLLEPGWPDLWQVQTKGPGPEGTLPLSAEMLRDMPSGYAFRMSEDAGMGWEPQRLAGPQFVILSNLGGLRAGDGSPVALGYHTGHFELGLAVAEAARQIKELGGVPYAGYCTDPCDGRTQGTPGMFDSLPYRNDAAAVLARLARSIPFSRGVLGVATCDKGLPAMMMALARVSDLPVALVPGGVTLPPIEGEDTAKIQSIGARFARGELSLDDACRLGCSVCASSGGGCHFLGTAATGQVVAEALGLTLPHAALAPSGQAIWLHMARQTAATLVAAARRGLNGRHILTEAALHNAMMVFAAFGGSTNFVLHLPAIAFSAGLPRPSLDRWTEASRKVPRLVDVRPNGPTNHPTVRVFLAGGVPEVMLHLREMELLHLDAMTISGHTLGEVLQWWEKSERRKRLRERLRKADGVDPEQVILSPDRAAEAAMTSTLCFPRGNLAPAGSVIKSTAIDPRVLEADGSYRKTGPARVFVRESDAIAAIKGTGGRPIKPGDVLVLIGRGPRGSGMEETYQITSALRYLSWGHEVAVVTDARFSGVSTGPCVGLVTPEALAGGPIGKLRDGDLVRIVIDRRNLTGSVDLVGTGGRHLSTEQAERLLSERAPHPELAPDPQLPPETALWAILQEASGGIWGGCVFDVEIVDRLLGPPTRAGSSHPANSGE